jgi:tyrosyl-tRNA synthetase
MTLSEQLTWRGFVNQTTFKDISAIDGEPISFFFGVDPSADSMQVGNLAAAMMVRHFMEYGHKATLLVGGATGLIGDPDGKKQERDLKEVDVIAKNVTGITAQYKTVFAGKSFNIVNNHDWFKDINYVDFLRTVGKHFSMTQLLDREFVQSRIGEGGSGISYAEFSYSLIQGYDFLHLYREKDVTLQLCGADQWGNSLAGVELLRKVEGVEAHVWSTPLVINKSTGIKFGKSEGGAVWLDAEKTSPYKFYQFWLNVDDVSVGDYIKIFTLIQPEEFDKLMAEFEKNPSERAAQKYLAYEVTKLVHGEDKAESARNVTATLFGDTPVEQLLGNDIEMLANEIPTTTSNNVINALVTSGVVGSNGEARRLIDGKAISVNGQKITEDQTLAVPSLIKKGKNTFILAR